MNVEPVESSEAAPGELWLLPALSATAAPDGRVILTRKFIDGAAAYVERWPGRVVVSMRKQPSTDGNLDEDAVDPGSLPFEFRWRDESTLVDDLAGAGLVLVSLVDELLPAADACRSLGVPHVFVAEYTMQTRLQIIEAQTRNPVLRWRRGLWTRGFERRIRERVGHAAGIQCNGTPTYDAYSAINDRPLLYFDTRVPEASLAVRSAVQHRLDSRGDTIRLAFSGRLNSMKGANHLVPFARALRARQLSFTLDVCGDGDHAETMRSEIAASGLAEQVRMRGVLDFHGELLPFLKHDVDLFVCCHPQGDPSCTYLETMACGVPIAGFDNEAFVGVVRESGCGWPTPLGDIEALADRIVDVAGDRAALSKASLGALTFAKEHTFEKTVDHRIDHMQQCADRPVEVAS